VIRTYSSLLIYRTTELLQAEEPSPVHVDLEPLAEPQGEGVGIGPTGAVVLTSEAMTDALPGSMSMLRCELPSGPE
jgi:hypothetical protein